MAKQKIYDPTDPSDRDEAWQEAVYAMYEKLPLGTLFQAWTDGCILDSNNEPEVANALGCDVEDLKTELTRQMNAEFAKELKK